MKNNNNQELTDLIKQLNVLMRVNNLIMSRFIMQVENLKKEIRLRNTKTFFKFEITDEDYNSLVTEFGKKEVDRQLYHLDRLLLTNKQNCPHNIKKYIYNHLNKRRGNKVEKDDSTD